MITSDALPTDGMGPSTGATMEAPAWESRAGRMILTAWFNVLPPYMALRSLASYSDAHINYLTGLPDLNTPQNYMPFPGRASSKIWFCPSATMSDSDVSKLAGESPPGVWGFFSYAQPIDLNKEIGTATSYNRGDDSSIPANAQDKQPPETERYRFAIRSVLQSADRD